jgi:hypothetical protein
MNTQMQWRKKEEDNSSETINERDRQVIEAIDQFLKATSEKGEAESYLPEVWTLAADILRIEIIHNQKTEKMTSIS